MANDSLTNETNWVQTSEPHGLRCFRLGFSGVVALASLVGNTIIIRSIMKIPCRKSMTYHMVLNLAVAELIGTIAIPFLLVYSELRLWPFGAIMCHLVNPVQISSCLVVTWTLAIISVHRYRTLVQSTHVVYLKNAPFFFAILWACAVIITFPSFLYFTVVQSPSFPQYPWCVVLFPGDTLADFPSPMHLRYLMVRFIINFIVPIMIMVLAYGAIVIKVRYHLTNAENSLSKRHENASHLKPEDQLSEPVSGDLHKVGSMPQQDPPSPMMEQEQDLLKMIYMIVTVFVLCYMPYQAFFFLEYFSVISYKNWEYFDITRQYLFLVTCLPSALHPLCYGTMCKSFAKIFRTIVLCKGTDRSSQAKNSFCLYVPALFAEY